MIYLIKLAGDEGFKILKEQGVDFSFVIILVEGKIIEKSTCQLCW